MSKTKKLLEEKAEKALNRFAEIAGIKKLNEGYEEYDDYIEQEKYTVAVIGNGYKDIGKVMIHSLTDEGVDFLSQGNRPKDLKEEHIIDSVSLVELVDAYNKSNGTDF